LKAPERARKPIQFFCATLPWKQLPDYPDIGSYKCNADNSPAFIGAADTGNDISNFAILIHEQVEAMWVWLNNVPEEEISKFDQAFFARQGAGEFPIEAEPGYAEGCPYAEGHFMAEAVERFVLERFGMMWSTHEENCAKVSP
jgi:hypothetical protein